MKHLNRQPFATHLTRSVLAAALLLLPMQALAAAKANTLLITHPRASVLRNYVMLVRQHVLAVDHLQIVGVYHESETEDYRDALDYLAVEHIDWIKLQQVKCALDADDVYKDNACRPAFEKLIADSAGIIFNGGPDIPPSLYGEPTLLTTVVETPHRHFFEVALSVALLGSSRAPTVHPILSKRPEYPVLGICVGMQTLNVAAGGTLIQDIPTQLYGENSVEEALHASPATWHRNHSHELSPDKGVSLGVMHPIHLTANAPSFLRNVLRAGGPEPQVLSIHHQAVNAVGAGFIVYGTSDDGKIVEVMGRHDFPNVLGLQFHPERSALWDKTEEQLICPKASTYNFAYGTLEKDPSSKAFNEAVWQWLARVVVHESHNVIHHS
jgi:putative glutamine amidotransferase